MMRLSADDRTIETLERWVQGRMGKLAHERRVRQIAGTLFELLAGRHKLPARWQWLLEAGAIVHDVGRCAGNGRHAREGARMLLRDKGLPLHDSERRYLAFLTRHHRGEIPARGGERHLKPGDNRRALRMVLGLLRAADALDGRMLESPRLLFDLRGRRLAITCCLARDCAKARRTYGRKKKFQMLERLLGCRVRLEVRVAEQLRLVA